MVSNKYQADLLNCYKQSYKTVSTLLLGACIKNHFILIIKVMEIHNDEVLNTVEQIVLLILQLLYYNLFIVINKYYFNCVSFSTSPKDGN